jgi:hypothetical protein
MPTTRNRGRDFPTHGVAASIAILTYACVGARHQHESERQGHVSRGPPEADAAKKPELHEARELAPRNFVGHATVRDDIAAPNLATLGSEPEYLILKLWNRLLGGSV